MELAASPSNQVVALNCLLFNNLAKGTQCKFANKIGKRACYDEDNVILQQNIERLKT